MDSLIKLADLVINDTIVHSNQNIKRVAVLKDKIISMQYIAPIKEHCLHRSSKEIKHHFKGSNSKLKDKASFLNLILKVAHLESRLQVCKCQDHNSNTKIYSNRPGSIKVSCRNNFQEQIMVSNRTHISKISSLQEINQDHIPQALETIIINHSIIRLPEMWVRA